jgi:hypothetical protein
VRIKVLHLGLALVLVSGTVAFATLSEDRVAEERGALAAGKGTPHLKARGKVADLYPGAAKTMKVRVRNGYGDRVRLFYLRTKAGDASPECTRHNLSIKRKTRTAKVIPAHRQRKVRVAVTMLPAAPEACQGLRFPLRFVVKGQRL